MLPANWSFHGNELKNMKVIRYVFIALLLARVAKAQQPEVPKTEDYLEDIRTELKKVFPELELVTIPFDHPIYHQKFDFPRGLPKIHEHDGKPAQGLGLIYEGRLVVFYSFESDLGNGWEDQRIHNDPPDKRIAALRMGANIIAYSFTSSM